MVKRSDSIQAETGTCHTFSTAPGSILECSLGNVHFIFIFLLHQTVKTPELQGHSKLVLWPKRGKYGLSRNFIYGHWKRWHFPLASMSWDDKSFNSGVM